MKTAELHSYVEQCLEKPGARTAFLERLVEMENEAGSPVKSDHGRIAEIAEVYIYAVIGQLEASEAAANDQDTRGWADPMIRIAVQYFVDPDDLIPDALGLYGLVDDAYLAHKFILRLSAAVEAEKGFPLIANLTDENMDLIRPIVGDEIAQKLDDKVDASINSITVRNQMARLGMVSGTLPTHDSELWAKVRASREKISWTPSE
ncbi:MAG: DUF1232 domain-containing protein [Pikeienuella sp.]